MELNKIELGLFSLFHHDVKKHLNEISNTTKLFELSKKYPSNDHKDLSFYLEELIRNKTIDLKDDEIGLTLNGGFDSRLILSVLLYLKKKPICFTYGDPRNRDIIISKQICEKFNLKFVHVVKDKIDVDWYEKWVNETIARGKGEAHFHRAHRTAAIQEFTSKNPIKILFTGHFGGESIRGLSLNNYFTSDYFNQFHGDSTKKSCKKTLFDYFIQTPSEIELNLIQKEISKLPWMSDSRKESTFYFLYHLIANIHHRQDIELFKTFVPEVVPVFMTNEFQEVLIKTRFHYTRRPNSKISKLNHPELYCLLLKYFEQALLDIPLSNGYKPSDYQKGAWYYALIRFYNKTFKKIKNYPSFKYDDWYIQFVKRKANEISDEVWEIFDKEKYFKDLEEGNNETNEGYWHKFSNPIFFDMLLKANLISR
jgi:asparagine synthetase B (glutamine-hydrolysing)